jgi:hypothetical protein
MLNPKKRFFYSLLCFLLLFAVISSTSITGYAEGDEKIHLSEFDFSDFSNWTSGFFTNTGTKYSSATIRTLDYLRADNTETYKISSSWDSFSIVIYEYTSDFSFVVSNTFSDGAEFTPNKATSYVGVYISSTTESKYNAFGNVFADGATVSIDLISDYDDSLNTVDFTNTSLFKKGKYIKKITSQGNSVKLTNTTNASVSLFDSFKKVVPLGNYYFIAPSDDYRLSIVEISEDGTALSELSFLPGDTYTPSDRVSGVALSIYTNNSSISVNDIKNELASGALYVFTDSIIISDPGSDDDGDVEIIIPTPEEPEEPDPSTDAPIIISPPIASLNDAHSFVNSMRAGWNLGNSLDSYSSTKLNGKANLGYETVWGNVKTNQEILNYVAGCGFDTIRIPVSWSYHTYVGNDGKYHIHETWLNRVEEIVDMSLEAGLKVILNSHHDHQLFYVGTDDASFKKVKGNFISVWTDIANTFKNYDNRLLFEAHNELDNEAEGFVYSDLAASQCNELNQLFVDTIRGTGGNNAERLLVIPTLMDKYGSPFMDAYILPNDSAADKLIIEIHMYSNEYDQSLDYSFDVLEAYSELIGAPIIIGEYGYSPSFTIVDRKIALSNYVARAAEHGMKTIVWDNGRASAYGIINRSDLSASYTDVISAIVNPVKNEGTPYIDITQYLVPGMKLTQSSGAMISDPWWGSMVASSTDFAVPLDSTAKYLRVKCINNGNAFSRNVHYVNFYDAQGNALKMNSVGYPGYDYKTYSIPKGAASMKICIFSSKFKTSNDEYMKYISDGSLKLLIGYTY